MRTFKAVVIGAGVIAKTHARILHQDDRTAFAAVADIDPQRAEELAGKYGAKAYADYRIMIKEERPDIAIVTLPHHLHKEASLFCIEQGCHILLEKPMAMNVGECAEINEAAKTRGVTVSVGHMQHFFPANAKAKEIIASGRLGRLVAIQDKRHYPYYLPERPAWFLDKARSGGGVLINLGSHSIDRIQWMTGTGIARVRAITSSYGERGNVEGSAVLFMQTSAGVPATVSLCCYDNVSINETELLFTGGQLKICGMKTLLAGTFKRGYEEVPLEDFAEPFAAQWSSVLEHVAQGPDVGGGGAADISGVYGQSVCAVVDAAYLSHDTGVEQDVRVTPFAAEASGRR